MNQYPKVFFDRYDESEHATIARVHSPDAEELELYCLERRWLHNRSDVSSIPEGVYTLLPWESPNHGPVYAFVGNTVTPFKEDVPELAGRWGNLLHVANYWKELKGCGALGTSPGVNSNGDRELTVWSSAKALKAFKEAFNYPQPVIAYVRRVFP